MVSSVSGTKVYFGMLGHGIMGPGLTTDAYSEYGVAARYDSKGCWATELAQRNVRAGLLEG
jgi:hypothetical protein